MRSLKNTYFLKKLMSMSETLEYYKYSSDGLLHQSTLKIGKNHNHFTIPRKNFSTSLPD